MATSFNNNDLLQVLDISIKHVTGETNDTNHRGQSTPEPVIGPAYTFEIDPLTQNLQRLALGIDVNECCLPPGWTARYSPTKKRVCFIHEATGTIQYTHPNAI